MAVLAGQAGVGVVVAHGVVLAAAAVVRRRGRRSTITARPEIRQPHAGLPRFAIVVPAHDEELLLPSTLSSLAALDYPTGLVSVLVVADHCTDGTVDVARAAGAGVVERTGDDPRGKSAALHAGLDALDAEGDPADAVVILDADTTVDPGFLRAVAHRLADGASVVQGHYGVAAPGSSPATAFRSAALALRHLLRPQGRMALGWSSGLFGNGMVFRRDVLRSHRFADHLAEDHQLQLDLLLAGVDVDFEPSAHLVAQMPATVEAATSQNERWERGRADLARAYVPRLLAAARRERGRRRAALVDAAVDLVTPPQSVLALATVGAALAGAAVAIRRPGSRSARLAAGTGVALVVGQAVPVLLALREADAPPEVYRALLGAPAQVVWKARLWGRSVSGRTSGAWVRTGRHVAGDPMAEAA